MSRMALTVNPVLERELRQRLRGRAAWVVLVLFLVVLALILRLVYDVAAQPESFMSFSDAQAASTVGRSIFHWLLFFMLGLICFIVPGLTAAAIAGERERQTLIPLQVTLLSARSIVLGKLVASLAFVMLLLVASLPLLSVSFLLGGVDIVEVAKGMAMLLLVAVAVACLSLACSSVFGRTQTATVAAYGIVAALVFGTPIVYGAQRALDESITGTSEPIVLVVNPFAATAAVVWGRTLDEPGSSSPFTAIQSVLRDEAFADGPPEGLTVRVDEHGRSSSVSSGGIGLRVVPGGVPFTAPDGMPFAGPDGVFTGPAEVFVDGPVVDGPFVAGSGFVAESGRPEVAGIPFWIASVLGFAFLAALGVVLAVWRISVPARARAG